MICGTRTYQEALNDWFRNAHDNFLVEAGKSGLGPRDLMANVNFFSRLDAGEDGKLTFHTGHSQAGSQVTLRAEMDVLVALTTCQHPLDPHPVYAPKPVLLEVLSGPPAGPDDYCRNFRGENQRAFALTELVAFAHRFETVLDAIRSGTLDLTPEVMHTMQRSADHLADLVEAARNEDMLAPDVSDAFLANLDLCLGADPEPFDMGDTPFDFAAIPLDFGDDPAPSGPGGYVIRFRPLPRLYANGHDPCLLIEALHALGSCDVTLDLSALPDWDGPEAMAPGLGWTLHLKTQESETVLHEIFEFVDGLCELEISPFEDAPAQEDPPSPVAASTAPAPRPEAAPPAASAAPKQDPAPGGEAAEGRGPKPTLRVDLDRVDRLINSVGELIINQAMIAQRLQDMALASDDDVSLHVEDYRLLARDIQEAVMAIRAQPVKPLFQRMSRILREAAEATGKSARLLTFGENTEVDKTVIERLADPLTHMIRNAVDHAIESREERLAAGKPAQRVIKKYPNRRLYDTDTSTYITLTEVKQLVMDSESFIVRDAKTNDDLTRTILLQIILEEEAGGQPMFSEAALANIIRFYGHAGQGFMGSYLEKNVQAISDIQAKLTEQSKNVSPEMWAQFMNVQNPMMQGLMGNYVEQSKSMFEKMQEQMFGAFGVRK